MSFMAGFGPAFAQSFQNAKSRQAQEEQDVFKLTYQDYISRRDKVDEKKKEDAKRVTKAQGMAEMYGQPPEAWTKIHDWLDQGYSDAFIADRLENGMLNVEKAQESQEAPKVSTQMEESGLAPKPAEAAGTPAPGAPPVDPEVQSPLNPIFTKRQGARDKAIGKIGEITGQNPADINSTLDGTTYTPPAMPNNGKITYTARPGAVKLSEIPNTIQEAYAFRTKMEEVGDPAGIQKAQKYIDAMRLATQVEAADKANTGYTPNLAVIYDDQGKIVSTARIYTGDSGEVYDMDTRQPIKAANIKVMTAGQNKEWTEIVAKNSDKITEFNLQAANLADSARLAKEMFELVGDDALVVGAAGNLAQTVDSLYRDITGGATLVQSMFKNQQEVPLSAAAAEAERIEDAIEAGLENGALKDISPLAVKRALLEAKAVKYTYLEAKANGQEGRSVAVAEFDNIFKTVLVNNPTAFVQGKLETLQGQRASIKQLQRTMNEFHGEVRGYKARHGFVPPEGLVEDVDVMLGDMLPIIEGKGAKTDNSAVSNELGQAKSGETAAPAGYTFKGYSPEGDMLFETPEGKTVRRKK